MKNILVVCGEHSADKYGSFLIEELKKRGDFEFWGIGGENLKKAGVELLYELKDMSVFGITDAIKKIKKILKIREFILKEAQKRKPIFSIHIDYPDFNISLAKGLRKIGINPIYYIPPTVWAWRYGRIKKIKEYFYHVFLIFPFEKEIYEKEKIEHTFVGHPIFEVIKREYKENFNIRDSLKLEDKKVILLMPGSRPSEVNQHKEPILEAVRMIKKIHREFSFILVKPQNLEFSFYKDYENEGILIVDETYKYNIIKESFFSISTSGTTNFELMVFRKPFVVIYKLNENRFVSKLLKPFLKKLIKIKNYSIVNILSEKKIVEELIEENLTGENIYNEFLKFLNNPSEIEKLNEEFGKILNKYRGRENPSPIICDKLSSLFNL